MLADQPARRLELASLLGDASADPAVAAMAAAIARRLSIRRRLRERRTERGIGALTSMPYTFRSDDIDLDRTIEVLTERPVQDDTDIVVRERTGSRRSVVLIVDVSGSMRGEKVRIAAATVVALCADLPGMRDQLGVVAFWSDAALIKKLTDVTTAVVEHPPPEHDDVVDGQGDDGRADQPDVSGPVVCAVRTDLTPDLAKMAAVMDEIAAKHLGPTIDAMLRPPTPVTSLTERVPSRVEPPQCPGQRHGNGATTRRPRQTPVGTRAVRRSEWSARRADHPVRGPN